MSKGRGKDDRNTVKGGEGEEKGGKGCLSQTGNNDGTCVSNRVKRVKGKQK